MERGTKGSARRKLLRALRRAGWNVTVERKHYKARPPSGEMVVFASTPSDQRAWHNLFRQLKHAGFDASLNAERKAAHA